MLNTKQEWKIGDCLDLLPEIPDKSIDMILTDLPYGTTACSWDTVIPFEPLWGQYKRIIKDNGAIVLTASQPFTSALIMSNTTMFKYCWIWQKERPSNFFQAKYAPLNEFEDVCIFSCGGVNNGTKNQMKYYPQGIEKITETRRNVNTGGMVGKAHKTPMANAPDYIAHQKNFPHKLIKFPSQKSIHPTQKPVALFEYLIKTYTNEGDTVHDSCLGSGTTLEACMNLNRNCIGFEISDEWVPQYKMRLRLTEHKLNEY